MKKVLTLLFLISCFLMPGDYTFGQEEGSAKIQTLGVDEVTRAAIAESLGIKIFRLEDLRNQEEVSISESIYDLEAFFDASYTRDEEPRSSVFAGTKAEEILIEGGLRKTLPWGTEVEGSWMSERDETDTRFVAVNPVYANRAELKIIQPILENSFGVIDRKRLEQVAIDVRRFNFETLGRIEDFVLEVRRSFWRTLATHEILMVHKKGLRDAWRFHQITEDNMKLGLLELPDLYASKANLKTRQIETLIAQNAAQDRHNDLKNLLSLPLEVELFIRDRHQRVAPGLDFNTLLRYGMDYRWDRKEAVSHVQERAIEIQIADSRLWPRFDFEASASFNGLDRELREASRQAWDAETPIYNLGFAVEMPLENREAKGRLNQAKLDHRGAVVELERLEENIAKEIDATHREVWTLYRRLEIATEIVDLQHRKLKEEFKRFIQGRSSSDLIIDYQRDYLLAQDLKVKASADYRISMDERSQASGVLLKPYLSEGDAL